MNEKSTTDISENSTQAKILVHAETLFAVVCMTCLNQEGPATGMLYEAVVDTPVTRRVAASAMSSHGNWFKHNVAQIDLRPRRLQ